MLKDCQAGEAAASQADRIICPLADTNELVSHLAFSSLKGTKSIQEHCKEGCCQWAETLLCLALAEREKFWGDEYGCDLYADATVASWLVVFQLFFFKSFWRLIQYVGFLFSKHFKNKNKKTPC